MANGDDALKVTSEDACCTEIFSPAEDHVINILNVWLHTISVNIGSSLNFRGIKYRGKTVHTATCVNVCVGMKVTICDR